uniref:Uncharacterized protein n=1 Tax=Rhizophora mucronata TaxID=61149 RepID=A0A2P2PJ81_RHIMU
MIMDSNPTP